ncbi:hypothetical protein CFII64_25424 [Pseudomonas sp. CFII64]|nr:hypothetical protein CFII64_25424 [Pseudomonas sp. CFII64]
MPGKGVQTLGDFNVAFKPIGGGLANSASDEREETFERGHGGGSDGES